MEYDPLRRGEPMLTRHPDVFYSLRRRSGGFVGGEGEGEQAVGGCDDRLAVGLRRLGETGDHELLAALEHLRPGLRILSTALQELLQPAPSVLRVQRLVHPVELHVRFGGGVAELVERLRALLLAADVLRLEVAEQAGPVDRVLAGAGLVDVAAERRRLRE